MALLLAAFTGVLFLAPTFTGWAIEYGDDDSFSAGEHDIPVVSRQQESLDRYVRREDDDSTHRQLPLDRQADDFDPVERCAFVAWPLPAPSELRRDGHVAGWYARGPPSVV